MKWIKNINLRKPNVHCPATKAQASRFGTKTASHKRSTAARIALCRSIPTELCNKNFTLPSSEDVAAGEGVKQSSQDKVGSGSTLEMSGLNFINFNKGPFLTKLSPFQFLIKILSLTAVESVKTVHRHPLHHYQKYQKLKTLKNQIKKTLMNQSIRQACSIELKCPFMVLELWSASGV